MRVPEGRDNGVAGEVYRLAALRRGEAFPDAGYSVPVDKDVARNRLRGIHREDSGVFNQRYSHRLLLVEKFIFQVGRDIERREIVLVDLVPLR